MDPTLRSAASGMIAQQRRIEVISNNLANVNTTAFKRSRAHFEDLLYQSVQGPSTVDQSQAQDLPEIQVGRGTRLAAVRRIHQQGPIKQTGRSLDLAIEGEGYLQVRLPDGDMAYTRDGSLSISDQGTLVTHGGHQVEPGIQIPQDAKRVQISRSGIVTATIAGSEGEPTELGRIELARFTNDAGLKALGENLYAETSASGEPVVGFPEEEAFGRVLSGHLEGSNVKMVQEMTEMIAAMRAYETGSRAIRSSERMSQITNQMSG